MAIDKASKPLDVASTSNTKTIDERVAKRIREFLLMWLRKWYPVAGGKGFHGKNGSAALGLSSGYVSDLTNPTPTKSPGLDVVLRLREKSGATFEEITGHKPPRKPSAPLRLSLEPDSHIADTAAVVAVSAPADEKTKSATRAPGVRGARKREHS